MFEPTGLGLEIFKKRYALHEDETWSEACERIARHISIAENGPSINELYDKYYEMLYENFLMPGGRIIAGAGRTKAQLLNCFVVPTGDSREGWGKTISDMIVIGGTGGGVGINFSPIRPRGTSISGTGGQATGAVSLMEIVNTAGEVIKAGGGRRTALMFALNIDHGDIKEFLDVKLDLGKLNNANVSIMFNENPEDFFNKVKEDADHQIIFRGKVIGKIPARKLWHKVVENMSKNGEPGILNGYYANKMSNVWYDTTLICTNPCVTGDTLIAVADGRNAVSIKQLAEEGNDVPVYSVHPGTGEVQIKLGIHPRVTGFKKEIWKLTLDDGSTIRATPNHKFLTRDLQKVELKDLKPGDSLLPFNSNINNRYRHIESVKEKNSTHGKMSGRQYRLIYEFYKGKQPSHHHIHHQDFNSYNDSIENLLLMTTEEHIKLHSEKMMGENNPFYKMSEEWRDKWRKEYSSHPGEKNGMYGKENKWGSHTEEAKQKIREKHLGKKFTEFSKKKLSESKIKLFADRRKQLGIADEITKECPACGSHFTVPYYRRENMYCSSECRAKIAGLAASETTKTRLKNEREERREKWITSYLDLKFELKREPFKKEFEAYLASKNLSSRFGAHISTLKELKEAASNYNHRVVSVEFCGHEDVYNITVEDNHNYGIITTNKDDKYVTSSGIYSLNCGELFLSKGEACCLGSLVLPKFMKNNKIDYDLLRETIDTAVSFLDNVLSVNVYPLPENKEVANNYRRIGLGALGVHDILLMNGLKYNSDEGLEFIDKLFCFIKNCAYDASIEIAKKKGAFPRFEADKFLKSGFCKTLKPSIRSKIKEFGIRNCALLTLAPTGTTSMVCGASSGIEPMFAPAYIRKYKITVNTVDEMRQEIVIHPLLKQFIDEGKSIEHFQGAHDLSLRDHFEMQRAVQKHIDNSVSKTINTPQGISIEELSDLLIEYFPELKGVTIYPEGSRENQPLTPLSLNEAVDHLINKMNTQVGMEETGRCRNGKCDL
jgi:ribonucleotide reductase alpha subunit